MAVLALSALGAGIGAALAPVGFTFLGMSGAGIGWTLGGIAGNLLFGPKLPDQFHEGPRIADTRFTSSAYGETIPIVFGTYPVAGNVIWASAVREVINTTSQRVGGKGGSRQTVTQQTYSYFVDLAILLCEGPIVGARKIKINSELKYDVSAGASSATISASALAAAAIRVYTGSETQTADPLISAAEGADAPAYRGYAYVVIESMDVTAYGGKPPVSFEFEVVTLGSASTDLAISAGVAVGTTATIGSINILGRAGHVWCKGAGSIHAVLCNYYVGAITATYSRALWTYEPSSGAALSPNGEAVFGNYGGFWGFLHDDGTVTEYTNAPGILGVNGANRTAFDTPTTGYAQGDNASGVNFYRFTLNNVTNQVDETLITAARSIILFANATAIANRCYVYGDTTYNHEIGYVTPGGSKVLLFSGLTYAPLALLVSSAGVLWMGRNGASTDVEKRDQDGTLLASIAITGGPAQRIFESANGYIWVYSGNGRVYGIHPTLHTIDFQSEANTNKTPLGWTEDNRLIFYSQSFGTWYLHEMEMLPRITVGTTQLSSALQSLITRVGLTAGDLSLASLTDNLRGYAIARRMPLRAALEPLLPAYRFDLIESDDVIKAVKRSGSIAATLDELDLGAHEYGEGAPQALISRRLLETELPLEVVVQYPDADADYEPGAQYGRRLARASRDPAIVQMPMVLSATEAQRLADVILYDRWVSRMVHELTLPRKYARLEPSDVISVVNDGATHTLMIVGKRETEGVISLECVADNAAVYSPAGVGASLPAPVSSIAIAGPSVLRLLDIPILRDADDAPGFYAVAAGYYSGWSGAELWRSINAGVSYDPTETTFVAPAPIGSALSVLGNFTGGNVFDEANTVNVSIFASTLESSTSELVLAGANAAYLGGELIQYRTATLTAPGKYTLSGLLRGRRGTEQYMSTHAIGDLFVALNTDTCKRITVESSEIGLDRLYKAPSFGSLLTDAAPSAFTLSGVGLECLSPVHLAAGRTANASWDITITWVRRTRVGGEWRDYVDASLGETSESYEVEIYDSSFTTLKRTITGLSSAQATYTSAQQVTDFGTNQTTVYVRVYQLSASVGRGFPAQGTLTL